MAETLLTISVTVVENLLYVHDLFQLHSRCCCRRQCRYRCRSFSFSSCSCSCLVKNASQIYVNVLCHPYLFIFTV